jgi:hypothetical protein
MLRSARGFGEPSMPEQAAADRFAPRQPNSYPLGTLTGAPPRTRVLQVLVTPIVNALGVPQPPTMIVPETRENRFITLTPPISAFTVYVNTEAQFNVLSALALTPGVPYEIALAGNQALYAVTNAPTFQALQVQIAPAISSDTERRL